MLYYLDLFYSKSKMRDIYRKVRNTKIYTVFVKRTTKVPLIGSLYHIHVKYIPDKLSIVNGNIINDGDYLYVYVKFDNSDDQTLIQGKYDINVDTTETMTVNGIDIPIRNIVQINKNDKVIYYEKNDTNFFIRNIPFYSLVFYNDDGKIHTGLGAAYPGDMISFKCINYWDGVIRNVNIVLPDIKDTIQNPITIDGSSYVELIYDSGFTKTKIVLRYVDDPFIKTPHLKLQKNNTMHDVFAIQIGEPVFWKNIYETAMRQRKELQYIKNNYPSDDDVTMSNATVKKNDLLSAPMYNHIYDIPKDQEYIGNLVYIKDHPVEYDGFVVFEGEWKYIKYEENEFDPFIPRYHHIYNIPEHEEFDGNYVYVENHSVKYSGYVKFYRGRWRYVEDMDQHHTISTRSVSNESINQTTSTENVQKLTKDISSSLCSDGMMINKDGKLYSLLGNKLVPYDREPPKDTMVHFIY